MDAARTAIDPRLLLITGVLLQVAVAAGAVLGVVRPPLVEPHLPPTAGETPAWVGVYPPIPRQPSGGGEGAASFGGGPPLEAPPTLSVLAGSAPSDEPWSLRVEALFRLGLYAAMRDVYVGAVQLDWAQARIDELPDDTESRACGPEWPETVVPEQPWPKSLGVRTTGYRDRKVVLRIGRAGPPAAVEVLLCSATGGKRSQFFEIEPGGEGTALRELALWLASQAGTDDVLAFDDTWARPPAASDAQIISTAEALVKSMVDDTPQPVAKGQLAPEPLDPYAVLFDAAQVVPEVAHLAAKFAPDRARRLVNLQRAAVLRPGFTAAIEDLAHFWLDDGRLDVALATATRFGADRGSVRDPVAILSGRLRDEGRETEAKLMRKVAPVR